MWILELLFCIVQIPVLNCVNALECILTYEYNVALAQVRTSSQCSSSRRTMTRTATWTSSPPPPCAFICTLDVWSAGVRLRYALLSSQDTCLHVAAPVRAQNLRALMYSIAPAERLQVKKIAGRIIPAIATTTAVIAGLVRPPLGTHEHSSILYSQLSRAYVSISYEPRLNSGALSSVRTHLDLLFDSLYVQVHVSVR